MGQHNVEQFIPASISWHNIDVFTKSTKKFYEFNKIRNEKQIIQNSMSLVIL